MGLKGEAVLDKTVLVVKTHFPERIGHSLFNCQKCILIVRNPLDCMASLFNMIATGTHSTSIKDQDLERPDVQELWQ